MESCKILVVYSLFFFVIPSFNSLVTISPGKSITANETLVSANGTFEAGFFSVDSERQFLGIWYKNISPRTYVWVANRDAPLENSSGVLQVTDGGILVILNSTGATVWSSSASTTAAKNPVAQLMDTGNLVVRDANNSDNILWQCFDHPADTLLPGMKLRTNKLTGQNTSMTSWRDTQDPSRGDYSVYIDTRGFPQSVITKEGQLMYRQGSWNGKLFSGVPWETLSAYFQYSLEITQEEVTYSYELLDSTMVTRYKVSLSGLMERYTWTNRTHGWEIFAVGPGDQCDNYALCGPNSNCDMSKSEICECLNGFIQVSNNWVDGCVRRTNLSCNYEDGFLKYPGMKLPDTSSSWYDESMNLEECKQECLKNCSCSACANLYVNDGGSGCLLWFDNILDTSVKTSGGQDLYVRLAASELDDINSNSQLNKKQLTGILVGCIVLMTGIIILGWIIYLRRKKIKKQGIINNSPSKAISGSNDLNQAQYDTETRREDEMDVPAFDLSTIHNATNYFSISNKLGEGGFGPVYKGVLANGQEVAVKRLSKSSGQGSSEFKNEAVLFANLQHRNLVKLIGCSIQNDERLLVYEFMPNRSLDNFIFDQTRSGLLHWTKCFQIINGVARGLLYLHQDSRLRIIHRDLKTSNILLDKNMNPKISDFGLARIFGADEGEANTKRVVGTYGYMPPEYAVHGCFSVKSDVFSFGVIVLEVVSGRKNREFYDTTHNLNLLGYAWRLWNEERPLELMDESLGDSVIPAEVLRCIHIGLLCVQERAEDRPNMSSVVLMLNGEKSLPNPREPGFYPHEETFSSGKYSTNEISISLFDAR